MDEPKKELEQIRQSLQRSADTRMRAIQERISTTEALFTTIEIEVRFGELDRAREHRDKPRSIVEKLIAHINNPAHVSDKLLKQEFPKQLTQIAKRLSSVDTQIRHKIAGGDLLSKRMVAVRHTPNSGSTGLTSALAKTLQFTSQAMQVRIVGSNASSSDLN
jgi:hypothetical protein